MKLESPQLRCEHYYDTRGESRPRDNLGKAVNHAYRALAFGFELDLSLGDRMNLRHCVETMATTISIGNGREDDGSLHPSASRELGYQGALRYLLLTYPQDATTNLDTFMEIMYGWPQNAMRERLREHDKFFER